MNQDLKSSIKRIKQIRETKGIGRGPWYFQTLLLKSSVKSSGIQFKIPTKKYVEDETCRFEKFIVSLKKSFKNII